MTLDCDWQLDSIKSHLGKTGDTALLDPLGVSITRGTVLKGRSVRRLRIIVLD